MSAEMWGEDLSAEETLWLTAAVTDLMADRPTVAEIAKQFQRLYDKPCSEHHLRMWIRRNDLQNTIVTDEDLVTLVVAAQEYMGKGVGARAIVDHLRQTYSVRVGRERVGAVMKRLTPDEVASRNPGSKRRRCRQPYTALYHMESVHADVNEKPLTILGLRWNAGVDGKT